MGDDRLRNRSSLAYIYLILDRKWYLTARFHFPEHERTAYRSDAVEVTENAEYEFLIGFHVGSMYLQEEVIIAGDIEAFHNFRNILHRLHNLDAVFIGMLFHP